MLERSAETWGSRGDVVHGVSEWNNGMEWKGREVGAGGVEAVIALSDELGDGE